LKGGKAGVTAAEIARLKKAARGATVNWVIAAFDGEVLQLIPELRDWNRRWPAATSQPRLASKTGTRIWAEC